MHKEVEQVVVPPSLPLLKKKKLKKSIFCFLWNDVFLLIFYIKRFVDLACFYTSK